MEGIPVPDVADYKRRKEIELGLNPGTITQPPPKKAKFENRVLSEDELRAQLEAHRALMGANDPSSSTTVSADSGTNGVYSATAQTYATPTVPPVPPPIPGGPGMPPPFLPGGPPPGGFGPPIGMPPG